ncbi:hypothetical protein [uncultured Paraglaciecola sp.]|jgi:hypothetical protein|nr:hypothetical protein [uncultured Paraglaciecola sp.]
MTTKPGIQSAFTRRLGFDMGDVGHILKRLTTLNFFGNINTHTTRLASL